MIDKFRKWLANTEIDETIKDLFKESLDCYMISAFKGAYLLSFVAFQNYLKEIIIKTSIAPINIESNDWIGIKTRLNDEDKYDSEVNNCVKKQKPGRIFMINDSIVQEYEYLRVLRNKCAHGKRGTINKSHIDVLWNFIIDNSYHFLINGGKDCIFQRILNHYDSTITPPNSSVDYLVFDIINCLDEAETTNLIEDIYNYDLGRGLFNVFNDNNRTIALWDALVNNSNELFCNCTIKFIINKCPKSVTQFVARYPGYVSKFLSNDSFCRKLWTGSLTKCDRNKEGCWIIVEEIINGKHVPDDEQTVFSKTIMNTFGKVFPSEKKEILEKTRYFDLLRDTLFDIKIYGYPNGVINANALTNAFFNYIDTFNLSKEIVVCINYILTFVTYGDFYDCLKKHFEQSSFLSMYKDIVSENELKDLSNIFETN